MTAPLICPNGHEYTYHHPEPGEQVGCPTCGARLVPLDASPTEHGDRIAATLRSASGDVEHHEGIEPSTRAALAVLLRLLADEVDSLARRVAPPPLPPWAGLIRRLHKLLMSWERP